MSEKRTYYYIGKLHEHKTAFDKAIADRDWECAEYHLEWLKTVGADVVCATADCEDFDVLFRTLFHVQEKWDHVKGDRLQAELDALNEKYTNLQNDYTTALSVERHEHDHTKVKLEDTKWLLENERARADELAKKCDAATTQNVDLRYRVKTLDDQHTEDVQDWFNAMELIDEQKEEIKTLQKRIDAFNMGFIELQELVRHFIVEADALV